MLTMLVLMLVLVPALWLYQSAADRQRVLDAQVRSMLKPAPRFAATVPTPSAPTIPAAPTEPASDAAGGDAPPQSR